MAILCFTQITDGRFNSNPQDLLLQRIDEIRKRLSELENVSVKTNNFRELEFEDGGHQYRCDFYVAKEGRKITWNDIMHEVNSVKGAVYEKSSVDFNVIEDIPYKPFEKQELPDLNTNVREWYMETYPSDYRFVAPLIKFDFTFKDLIGNEEKIEDFVQLSFHRQEIVLSELALIEKREENVRDYCVSDNPLDEECKKINPDITFKDIFNGLNKGEKPENILGINDEPVINSALLRLAEAYNIAGAVVMRKALEPEMHPAIKAGQKFNDEYIHSVLNAVPMGLKYFNDKIKDDEKFVFTACRFDGANLQFVSERLKDNVDVVKAAIQNYSSAILYASDRIKEDISLVDFKIKTLDEKLAEAKSIKDNKEVTNWYVERTIETPAGTSKGIAGPMSKKDAELLAKRDTYTEGSYRQTCRIYQEKPKSKDNIER